MTKEGKETIHLLTYETNAQSTIEQEKYFDIDGIIVIYDVTDQESFKSVQNWILPMTAREEKALVFGYRVNKLLIGNKADLLSTKVVSFKEGKMFADEGGMQFMETSAKVGDNVNRAFHSMAMDIKQRITIEGFGRYSLVNDTAFVVTVVEATLDTTAV